MLDNKAPRGSIAKIILKALSTGDKYGYEICKDIEKITKGKLVLKQPSLYSCLRRMEEQGLINSYWEDSDFGGRRHYYSLTDNGKNFLDNNNENFLSEEELIATLPRNEELISEENSLTEETQLPNKQSFASVLKQENLFDLSKTKAIFTDLKNEESKSETNNSFFQFDLFNENVSFIKEESSQAKQNIPTFVNKYTELDNHYEEIEPFNDTDNQIFNKKKHQGEQQSNDNSLSPTPDNNFIDESQDVSTITKNDYENQFNSNLNSPQLTTNTKIYRTNSNNQISWEINTIETNQEQNSDYRSIIGQLYNNSRLPDPYEQNKYQTFKEIFPSSNLNKVEKTNNNEKESRFDYLDDEISNSKTTIEESNIDCEDFRNLNNLYNLQGIEIKIHDKNENRKENKIYTDKNKLNMVNSWIVSLVMLLEILFSYLILKSNKFIIGKQRILFYLALAFTFSYCLISTLENLFDRYRLVVIEKNLRKSFIYKLFAFIISVILIFTLNIIFGMNNLFQIEYFTYWFVPILLLTNLLSSTLIYSILLKSKNFSS